MFHNAGPRVTSIGIIGLFAAGIGLHVISPTCSEAQQTGAGDSQLFRSSEHRFRIRFPAGWVVKDGDGEHVVKKATYSGATVLVLVRSIITPDALAELRTEMPRLRRLSDAQLKRHAEELFNTHKYSRQELNDFLDEQVTFLKQRFPGTKIEQQSIRHLDNRPAAFAQFLTPYTVLDRTVTVRGVLYSQVYKGTLYQVHAAAPANKFQALKPSIDKSISTFVLEDW